MHYFRLDGDLGTLFPGMGIWNLLFTSVLAITFRNSNKMDGTLTGQRSNGVFQSAH